MRDPITPHKIAIDPGLTESWPEESGLTATVVFECAYKDRFKLMRELRGGYSSTATTFGQFTPPHRYPPLPMLYCHEISDVKGQGLIKGRPASETKWAPYTTAFLTAKYRPPTFPLTPLEGLSQAIDPGHDPVLYCKQKVKASAAFRTISKNFLKFESGKRVIDSAGVPEVQTEISLEFPRVPFNPYLLVKPYLGTINSLPMFGHGIGEVLFDSIDTEDGQNANSINFDTADGLDHSVTLTFLARQAITWNMIVNAGGNYEKVVYFTTGRPLFQSSNLLAMLVPHGTYFPPGGAPPIMW